MEIPDLNRPKRPSDDQSNVSMHQGSFYQSNDTQVNLYKKKLLRTVIGISVVILLIIIERIFYEVFLDNEVTLLHNIQNGLGLIEETTVQQENGGEISFWKFKAHWFWDMFGYLDLFKYNFLILTAFIGVMFVSIDSLIAVKVGYMGIYSNYLISCLEMVYGGPRPFWQSDTIGSPVCLNTYSHPSRSAFILYFLIFYTVFCFRRRVINRDMDEQTKISVKYKIFEIVLSILVLLLVLIKYLMGSDFIINILLAVMYFLIYYYSLKFMDSYIDSLIQKSTIQERSAKKYVFYWFLYLVLSETFATILYSSQDYYAPTEWIKNFIQCSYANGTLNGDLPYDEILGPWFTFIQTSCLFALIGAVFGVAYTYRNTAKNYNWYRGSLKNRIYRSLMLILCMGPSIILTVFQGDIVETNWVKQIGINEFFLSAFHYFFLYFFLFGILPSIFKKIGLIEDTDEDGYNILQNNQQLSFIGNRSQFRTINDQRQDNVQEQ
ncbi:hypothetical protein ABPG74_022661 [Tetrahymena malaccensis]